MSGRIDRVDSRARLEVRRDPHWQRIGKGRHVGFRKLTQSSPGTWIARAFNLHKTREDGTHGPGYDYKALGDFTALPDKERYDAAKVAADDWFKHLDLGGSTDICTVEMACAAYVAKLRQERSEDSADDAEGTFRRLVKGDSIAGIKLQELKPHHVSAWRQRIFERGSKSYFNRNLTPLRAALNLAFDERKVSSDFAWSKALRPLKIDSAEGRRTLYLDRAQRRKLVEKASNEFRPLLESWTLLPLRPGDVAKLKVEHFNAKVRELIIPTGKTGRRSIPLATGAVSHFKECAKSKLPGAWLVSRADGKPWDRFAWRSEMKDAAKAAKLPLETCAYTLRHSTITDLVTAGVDIFTVAKLSGTSVAMIEKHYGHLQREHAREALAGLSLTREAR